MELFLGLLALLFIGACFAAGVGLIGFWVYWWCSGMIDIMHIWIGLPGWATIVIAICIALFLRPGMLILAIVGFIGWTFTLHYNWFTGLLVYAPTIAFMFVSFFTAIVIGVFALIAQTWYNIIHRR